MTSEASQPAAAQPPGGRVRGFRSQLGLFDFTLLVVGAVVGDGIFVVGALGARAMGPAQLVAWLAAGGLAALIALAFVQCAAIDPNVGGSYSYARMAFGPFAGFLAGWMLYIGEWTAVSAFPQAFFNYFQSLTGISDAANVPIKVLLVVSVTALNISGIKRGARTNDLLTMAKLVPLGLLMITGLVFIALRPGTAGDHLSPFAPIGYGGFSETLLLVFWAYAGFELAVVPAGEVKSPTTTLPRGLIIAMAVVTLFYLLTALAVTVAAPWQDTAASSRPLAFVMQEMLRQLGLPADIAGRLMSLGGLISIAGVFVVFSLSLARLSYALGRDGFLPSQFAHLHSRFETPYVGIAFLGACSLTFSTLFGLGALLTTAVMFLSITYMLTALSAVSLSRSHPERRLHLPGIRVLLVLAVPASLFLTVQASLVQIAVLMGAIAAGLVLYFAHARHAHEQRDAGPGEHGNHLLHPFWRGADRHHV